MSCILSIDTSTNVCSVAVSENGACIYHDEDKTGPNHAEKLGVFVDQAMSFTDSHAIPFDAVAVSSGPGSYTGLRIGVSAAKGLAWAKGLPCCGVSTLAAMAYGVGDFNGLIVGAMDARRQQVYNALFKAENGRIIRLCDDRAVSCEYVAQELRDAYPSENDILIVGDGAELLYKHLQAFGIPCRMASPLHRYQSAAGAALAAEALAAQGRLCSAQELQPVYLRLSQAERERLAKGLPLTAE